MSTYKPRVLMILDSLNVGGTETYVLSVTKKLLNQGYKVVIAARSGPIKHEFYKLDCPVYIRISAKPNVMFKQLTRIIKIHKLNVISAHQTPSALVSINVSYKLKIPFVFTLHGTYYNRYHLKKILRYSHALISVSDPVKQWLEEKKKNPILIPNGINVDEFSSIPVDQHRLEYHIPMDAPVLLYAGRLAWRKADICKDLIQACKDIRINHFPNLQLIVAGDGKYFDTIKNWVDGIHLEVGENFIHMIGNQHNMTKVYSLSDCVIGTGRVALEAMACERTVIAVGSKGYFGLVQPSRYEEAKLQYFGDHAAPMECTKEILISAVSEVLGAPKEREEWGRQGRNFIIENYELTNVVQRLITVYESVLR